MTVGMNRTIKDATIKTYHYDDLENLKVQVMTFVTAYNFAKHTILATSHGDSHH